MDAARAAVNKFTSNRGHHTEVEETINPAVTRETVKPVRHEETTAAIDREVHQHHYHTTVQPLQHQEKLPEKHTHNILPTEHREYRHENEEETKQRLAADLGRFRDEQRVEGVRETREDAGAVTGEHVHHHVHETVVPVVQKETIQPEVVHTTVPVHEKHHAASQHHGLSALPMKTLDEFKQAGGVLEGGTHGTHEEYDGPPRKYNEKLSAKYEDLGFDGSNTTGTTTGNTTDTTGVGRAHHHQTGSGVDGVGAVQDRNYSGRDGNYSGRDGEFNDGNYSGREGEFGRNTNTTGTNQGTGYNSNDVGNRTGANYGNETNTGSTGTTGKPSLKDRLNPKVDADGDGKAGLLS